MLWCKAAGKKVHQVVGTVLCVSLYSGAVWVWKTWREGLYSQWVIHFLCEQVSQENPVAGSPLYTEKGMKEKEQVFRFSMFYLTALSPGLWVMSHHISLSYTTGDIFHQTGFLNLYQSKLDFCGKQGMLVMGHLGNLCLKLPKVDEPLVLAVLFDAHFLTRLYRLN